PARVVLREVLDDRARLGNGPLPRLVTQQGNLRHGPQLPEGRARCLVGEVDDVRHEGRVVLVQRDQHLLAERRQRMEVELERHGPYLFFARCFSSSRACSIAGLGAKSSSSKSCRISISPSCPAPWGAGARLAHSIASSLDFTWMSQ